MKAGEDSEKREKEQQRGMGKIWEDMDGREMMEKG